MPHGVIDAPSRANFIMKIANFSEKSVRLRKGVIVGMADGRPEYVICPLLTEGRTETDSLTPDQESWISEVNLDHLEERLRKKVLTLLRNYASVCDGSLGTIKGTSHRIEIVPGAKPIYQQPYRCGIERRKAEEAEVSGCCELKRLHPPTPNGRAQSSWFQSRMDHYASVWTTES